MPTEKYSDLNEDIRLIVLRAQQGEQDARNRVAVYARELLMSSFAPRWVVSASIEDRSDLIQEAVIKVLRGLQVLRFSGESSFRSWILHVANHTCCDRADYHLAESRDVRKTSTLNGVRDTSIAWGRNVLPDPAAVVESNDITRKVRAMIRALPTHDRKVAESMLLLHRSARATARRLGLTLWDVKQTHARVRADLADRLARDLEQWRKPPQSPR